jgi:hypothetical protein
MPYPRSITRSVLCAAAVALALLTPATAGATTTRQCRSSDLRYPFQPGGPNDFGVFRLRVAGGSCATAHRVAKAWMDRFETNLRAGHIRLGGTVRGFAFRSLPANAAQTYRLRGVRRATTIRFAYVVPNG